MTIPGDGWDDIVRNPRDCVAVAGVDVSVGSRVLLKPRAGGDLFDLVLAGRVAIVEAVEEDTEGNIQLAITVEDDPGRDLGVDRQIGHRFFFTPDEVEPLPDAQPDGGRATVLVAGIGNVFMADDGFGVVLAKRLMDRPLPDGVEVREFGIRGMDLVYALNDGYEAAVLLDATPLGGEPGTLYVIEPEVDPDRLSLDTHGMDPARVLRLAEELGPVPSRTLVVGCEPATRMTGDEPEVVVELSEPVRAAMGEAVALVESLFPDLMERERKEAG